MAVVTATFVDSGYGLQASNRAEAAASAGVEDAYLNLVRKSTFSSGRYTVTSGSVNATVTVTQSNPSAGLVKIISIATIGLRTRKVQAVVSANATTGQITLISWSDVL